MPTPEEASPEDLLDRIARSGEAVMAINHADKIILWNQGAERLLSRPSRSVMGRPCYDILSCRDLFGNLYCYRACAVAQQARDPREEPVRSFLVSVKTGEGKTKRVSTSAFTIPSSQPTLSTVVHVFREANNEFSELAGRLANEAVQPTQAPTAHAMTATPPLTPREREILRCIAQGMPTPDVARKFGIAPVTVRNHVQGILHKLRVNSKLAAVAYAYEHGLV